MRKNLTVFIAALFILFFLYTTPLSNGRRQLARIQFEAAKQAFTHQEYFTATRLANLAGSNEPESSAPWLLIGHCFYLQGQDSAALHYYSMAQKLDPKIEHLPPFVERLRQKGRGPAALALNSRQMFSLRKKIGQMIMVSVPGSKLSGQKKAMLNAGWIGGVILFDQNIQSKEQIAEYVRVLQDNAPTPLFVAVDQEGGAVRRFREAQGFQGLPSLGALGKTRNPKLAYRFGLLSGKQLRDAGANLNLAPVVDIDYGLLDSIISKYHRSLGNNPEVISSLACEIVRGMKAQNVIATAKHFPTQSVASGNPHQEVSVTGIPLPQLEKWDFLPYRRLIQEDLLDAVMLSHVIYKNVDPFFPASLSPEMIQVFLRQKLGYKGLVISDDLRMDAIKQRFSLDVSAVQAVNAGVDVLLVTDNYERRVMDTLVNAVVSGKIPMKNIDEAYQRIMRVKSRYGILALKKRDKARETESAEAVPAKPSKDLSKALLGSSTKPL